MPFGAAWFVLKKRVNLKKGKKIINVLTMIAAFITGCGFAKTWATIFITGPVSWISSQPVKIGVVGALLIVTLGVAAGDILSDKKADMPAQICACILPIILAELVGTFLGIPGARVVDGVFDFFIGFAQDLGGR